MFRTHLMAAAHAARRTLPSLGLAAALLTSALGTSSPALAQDPKVNDHRMGGPPTAHVQIHVKQIRVLDDRDWGDGEFEFWFSLICHEITSKCLGTGGASLDTFAKNFSASSGETYTFDAAMPGAGLLNPLFHINPENGYPLRPDHEYVIMFGMMERDKFTDYEKMGRGEIKLLAGNNWGIGAHTMRSVRDDGSAGDYVVDFEVRPVSLPDLRPVNIKVTDLPGSTKKRVCTAVQNIETAAAGPFEVMLRVGDTSLVDGHGTAPGLTSGNATEVCAEAELPAAGSHKLTAFVDPGYSLAEYNEANNSFETTYTATQKPGGSPKPTAPLDPAASTLPAAVQGAAQVDLTVTAIKVNGQAPDGKSDCKDGKNTVAVTVKNAGTEKAGTFAVRLGADGDEVSVETVDGLDAGKEREVRFEDVRLKKGEHQLTASVDSKKAVAESDEANNDRQVTARCQSDS